MVKFFTASHTFSHPFDAVSAAFLRKYPNSRAPHVKSVDTVERSINSEGHLVIKRVIVCESAVPSFMSSVLSKTCSALLSKLFLRIFFLNQPKVVITIEDESV